MDDEFADIAEYYDELYVKPEQYQREAARVSTLIETYKLSGGNTLLDLACGTGGHIPYWRDNSIVTGLDLSPAMLDRAIHKFPDVEFHLGNMVDFVLEQSFDAIVCLYGSIGFVRTRENLNKTLLNFAEHLILGGVLCLTPWSTQEEFKPKIVVDAVKQPHVRISRMENVKRKAPDLVEVDFHHLVGRDGIVTYHTQSMEIGLFSRQQYLDALSKANLELMEYYEGSDISMGLFVARKRGL
jgi:SAM-dependent methyltransferase